MNDFALESKLKGVPVPERSDEYWDDFPSRVRVQLPRERHEFEPQNVWCPRFAWAGALALAAVLVFVCIQFRPIQAASAAITRHEQQFHAQLARLDVGLHVLMLDQHGMSYLVAEKN